MAMAKVTAKTKTGEDNDDNSRGWQRQQVRTATTIDENEDTGKEGNSEENGNDGKDDR